MALNGTCYVVEAILSSKAKVMAVVSAYMDHATTKNGDTISQLPDAKAPWFTPKSDSTDVSPNLSIPASSEKSNGDNSDVRTLPAPGMDFPSAAEGGSVSLRLYTKK